MKVNENTIYIFLLGILAGIICMQCVNHFRKSPKDVYVDNFEYEKESLGILKREELKNEHYECLDQIAYWGTDALDSFSLSNLCNDILLFFRENMSSLYRCSCRYNERGFYRRGNKNKNSFRIA